MREPIAADKAVVTAIAQACMAGVVAVPSLDERGRPTLILSRGAWCKEVPLEGLAAALEEAKAVTA